MIITRSRDRHGFTLGEVMIAVSLGSFMLAALFLSATALKKSMAALDRYFAAHVQQIRIIDYLSRDVKRSTIVQTPNRLTVKCWIPNYLDNDTRRIPGISNTLPFTVDYGSPNYAVTPPTGVTEVEYYLDESALDGTTSIMRKENGVVTAIASGTDKLISDSVDLTLTNTQSFTKSAVTFMPTFISGSGTPSPTDARRLGTSVYSLAYLRNLRRGN